MKFFNENSTRNFSLDDATLHAISAGAICIFPTETIYGIGCSALQEDSIARVFQIKGRAPDKPPPVLIGDQNQLSFLVKTVPDFARALMEKHWPGALTLVLAARAEIPTALCSASSGGSTRTVGVRLTSCNFARELCLKSGAPMVATSANFSGAVLRAATPATLRDIPVEFQTRVDFVFDGGEICGTSSTVVDCSGDAPRVLRAGAIQLETEREA